MQRQAEECTNFLPEDGWALACAAFSPVVEVDGGQRTTPEPKKLGWLVGSEECAELRRAEPTTPHPPMRRRHVMSAERRSSPTFLYGGVGGSYIFMSAFAVLLLLLWRRGVWGTPNF